MPEPTNPTPPPSDGVDSDTLFVVKDGKVYRVPKGVYTQDELGPNEGGIIKQLVKFGVTLADIPQSFGIGIGSFCFLVNLDSLRSEPPVEPTPPPAL